MNLRIRPELLDDIISEALQHVDRRGSEYTIIADPSDETILANVDGRLIVQVLINLINNAIQYTPSGSTIRISTRKGEDTVTVTVADNGPGIPDSEKEQVFTMFYSGRNKVTDSKRSLGLRSCAVPFDHPRTRLRDPPSQTMTRTAPALNLSFRSAAIVTADPRLKATA